MTPPFLDNQFLALRQDLLNRPNLSLSNSRLCSSKSFALAAELLRVVLLYSIGICLCAKCRSP